MGVSVQVTFLFHLVFYWQLVKGGNTDENVTGFLWTADKYTSQNKRCERKEKNEDKQIVRQASPSYIDGFHRCSHIVSPCFAPECCGPCIRSYHV